ncbi:MAG: arginine--tRNA ligase [Candidatus Eisenbacteria bacterium]|nr:arginine--tRNA ligase [Candidatus Eisenbacteria bacterium]
MTRGPGRPAASDAQSTRASIRRQLLAEVDLEQAIAAALERLELPIERVEVAPPRDPSHGDAATNVALALAKRAGRNPREVAAEIVEAIDLPESQVESVEIAGPGFINFRFAGPWYEERIREIVREGEFYGCTDSGKDRKIQIEFVSANPTGPLNVVSARAAAVGDALGNLLEATGVTVQREYYVNDAGQQIEKLALSVDARYRELGGEAWEIPEGGYHGEYVKDVAARLREADPSIGDMSDEERVEHFRRAAVEEIVAEQKAALDRYGVHFDRWFRESELAGSGEVEAVLEKLKESGEAYEKEDALWLRTSTRGTNDDKVIVKSDGLPTYLLPDAAYHVNKFERGFDPVIDLWGPDHHSHIAEMHAALEILGYPRERLEVEIIQQVNFIEGGKQLKMSKRAGTIVTLQELVDDVGVDVAKFFFLMRKSSAHLDFDLDLAREQTDENPVFYVQYAHARVASLIRFARERGTDIPAPDAVDLSGIDAEGGRPLILLLSEFPRQVEGAAQAREPHRITTYLRDVSSRFHSYYHDNRIVTDDPQVTDARLFLSQAVKTVLGNGLRLLGIDAPERM